MNTQKPNEIDALGSATFLFRSKEGLNLFLQKVRRLGEAKAGTPRPRPWGPVAVDVLAPPSFLERTGLICQWWEALAEDPVQLELEIGD
jgi:hypothetical protein